MYYLRIKDNSFGFVVEGMHDIVPADISITQDEYNNFFEQQTNGKQFRLKQVPTGSTLFDYVEEFTSEPMQQVVGTDELLLDLDFRLSKLELGGMQYDL